MLNYFLNSNSVLVHTSQSDDLAYEDSFGRYFFGACSSGLPLNSDGVSCSGDCHPIPDEDEGICECGHFHESLDVNPGACYNVCGCDDWENFTCDFHFERAMMNARERDLLLKLAT